MTVTERHMGQGAFSVRLSGVTPTRIRELLNIRRSGFGHVVITRNPVDVAFGDGILGLARYTGVYLRRNGLELSGCGPAMWISDADGKGPTHLNLFTANGYFSEWMAWLRPTALSDGFYSPIGTSQTWNKAFLFTNYRDALDEVSTAFGTEWRVNPDFSFDAGYPADLFRTTPEAVIVKRAGDGGRDRTVTGLVGNLTVEQDVEDVARRVLLVTGDPDAPTVTPSVSGISNADYPWRGPDGAAIRMDKFAESSEVPAGKETSYATNLLNLVKNQHDELTLSTRTYDIGADIGVGDVVNVFDPDIGIVDRTNPVTYRGATIYPQKIRAVGYTYPIQVGMGVYLRWFEKHGTDWVVQWEDLTRFVEWETGDTTVEVGALPRKSRR